MASCALSGRSGSVMPGSLSEQLLNLRLASSDPTALTQMMDALGDVLCNGPTMLHNFESDVESKWWDCFAEVFLLEVKAQHGSRSPDFELSTDEKRQILADILVWAEITQEHYDRNMMMFVTQPHKEDESFQRIGRFLSQVKSTKDFSSSSSGLLNTHESELATADAALAKDINCSSLSTSPTSCHLQTGDVLCQGLSSQNVSLAS